MGSMSRDKGQRGEREAAALVHSITGYEIKRRVRQHDGDSDLDGIPGWSVEVKRHASATRSDIGRWWWQAEEQAQKSGARPLLLYRVDRDEWRAVWRPGAWPGYQWTVEGTVQAWAAFAGEDIVQRGEVADGAPV